MSKEDRFLHHKRPDIFDQVNRELTAKHCPEIKLETLTYGSKKKIWWNCLKDALHVWDATPNERTNKGQGCLICAGYRIIAGINDLAFLNPVVAAEWHSVKNGELTASEVSATTGRKAWWQCNKDSRHIWEARIDSRHYGAGCPVCVNQLIIEGINDFATYHPELLSEWSYELNSPLTPNNVAPSSKKKIWWKCPKDERHVYCMSLNNKHYHGCPVCAGKVVIQGVNDVTTRYPKLTEEWHPTLNGDLKLTDFAPVSDKSVWWICRMNPSHEWKSPISSRTNMGAGCSVCRGLTIIKGLNDLATHNPELATEWHPFLNQGVEPSSVAPYGYTKYWWQCKKDNSHVWEASPNNRNSKASNIGTGCPQCIFYKTEGAFRDLFNDMTDFEFIDGRVPVKWSKRNFTQIDILNEETKICIEYDGLWSHGGLKHSPIPLEECIERDVRKTEALLAAGYKVIRIREDRLPHLPISNPNYFQVTYKLGEDKNEVVQSCIEFIKLIPTIKIH